jgi:hypothetical protein
MTPIKRLAFSNARHIIWNVVPFNWEEAHYIRSENNYSSELIYIKWTIIKEVVNVQRQWDSPNTSPIMVHRKVLCITTCLALNP